jgi:ATP-binding cassette, subfamily B, bacterial MsbA
MVFRRILAYARPLALKMIVGLVFAGIGSAATIAYYKVGMALAQAVQTRSLQELFLTLLAFIGLNLLKNASSYAGSYTITSVGQQAVATVRTDLFRRIQYLPLQIFDTWRSGELMSRFDNDVNLMVVGVSSMPLFVTAALTLVGSVATMLYLNWKLTLVLIAVAPFVALAVSRFSVLLRRTTTASLSRIADVNAVLQESIESMRVVKAFAREPYEMTRFTNRNDAYLGASMKLSQIGLTQTPVVDFIVTLGVAILAGYSFHEVIVGHLTIEAWTGFFTLAIVAGNPVNQLANYVGDLNKAMVGARRIFEILDLPVEVRDAPGAKPLAGVRGAVDFDDVRFAYVGRNEVLKGVKAHFEPGEVVALVGPSGAGKTTLVNLIPRFYLPTAGHVLVDGHDIADVTLESLRSSIAIVPQDPQLFSDTIENNIRYGRLDATVEEIRDAARLANAEEFIARFPEGYNTKVGARGMRLSGGERQRIAIARAILRDPRILILDEATSSLDAQSEALVNDALEHLLVGRTTFIIAHRFSTIRRASTILVLEDGHVVERGRHADLVSLGGLYAKLYETQIREPVAQAD